MKAVRSMIVSATVAASLPACSTGQRLDRAFAAVVADPVHGMSSLSALAIRGGKVSYEGQFGMRHVGAGRPANRDTMYRIASVSKLVTTIGVMRLVEQGKLSLDQDVGTYLGFALRNPAFPAHIITLRMLLSHTSSLRDDAGYSWGGKVALRDVVAQGGALWAMDKAAGRYFAYCNLNWGVVGTIMEAVTGERFDRLMRHLALQPLGLRGGYNVAEFSRADWSNVATLYRKRATDDGPWHPAGAWFAQVDDTSVPAPPVAGLDIYVPGRNGTLFSPTGGLRISAADLGTIMLMLLDQGRHRGAPFLQGASVAAMFSREWTYSAVSANGDTQSGRLAAWGLGAQHFEERAGQRSSLVEGGGFNASGHLGDAYGLLSVFAMDFVHRNGMVALIGGTVHDPVCTPGRYSALSRQEEMTLTPLYRNAVLDSR